MQHITLLHSLLYIEKGSGIGFPVIGTKCFGDRKEKGKSCNETIQGGTANIQKGASREDRSTLKSEPS